jgi:hypothetical protein
MPNQNVHSQDFSIKIKQGLTASINALATVYLAVTGEPHYTTNGKKLYMFDGTINRRVHGLDLAVTYFGEIVSSSGEIVWKGEYQ